MKQAFGISVAACNRALSPGYNRPAVLLHPVCKGIGRSFGHVLVSHQSAFADMVPTHLKLWFEQTYELCAVCCERQRQSK